MRKAAVALGAVGIGTGILYAFGRAHGGSHASDEGFEKVSEPAFENEMSNSATGTDAISDSKTSTSSGMSESVGGDFEIDDRGTDQTEAIRILTQLKDDAFSSSDEKLALALGRSADEIRAWTRGEQPMDSDVLMKARALALERGVTIEDQK